MNRHPLCLSISLVLGLTTAFAQNPPAAATSATVDERIAAIKALKIDGCTITTLQHDDAPELKFPDGKTLKNVPPRTVVKIVLNPAKGSNINVELWLPDADKWNGRLVGLGNGGAAGRINPGSLAGYMGGKFAAVTTDMGTAPNEHSGDGNPEVWKDFGFRATHLMTVVAKQMAAAYYGHGPELSYFSGGSTGGEQAYAEAQRYPEDYDGIVGTVPAHCRTPLHAYFLWNDQIMHKCPFTKEQEANVIAAGNEYMAARETPPVAGKFVSDPRYTVKDIEAVIALALKKDPSLTPAHAEALHKLFGGPVHAVTGERIFEGIPFGASLSAATGRSYPFTWVFGPQKDVQTLDFGADFDKYTAELAPYLNAENADLSAFEKRGGKFISATGAADSVVPCFATLDYYERVIEHFGSLEKTQSFFRLYLVPGLAHGTSPGLNTMPNFLEAIRNWRENGVAPDELKARRVVDGKTELEMPIYPYPAKAGWDTAAGTFKRVDGPRGGVERIAARFRPPAKE
jgi:feruloyl esterase